MVTPRPPYRLHAGGIRSAALTAAKHAVTSCSQLSSARRNPDQMTLRSMQTVPEQTMQRLQRHSSECEHVRALRSRHMPFEANPQYLSLTSAVRRSACIVGSVDGCDLLHQSAGFLPVVRNQKTANQRSVNTVMWRAKRLNPSTASRGK